MFKNGIFKTIKNKMKGHYETLKRGTQGEIIISLFARLMNVLEVLFHLSDLFSGKNQRSTIIAILFIRLTIFVKFNFPLIPIQLREKNITI